MTTTRSTCRRGHEKTPDTVSAHGRCLVCERLRRRRATAARRARREAEAPEGQRMSSPRGDLLPVEPIRGWLNDFILTHDDPLNLLSERANVSMRLIYRLRNVNEQVMLDTVDRLLIAADVPHVLNELYPVEAA